MKRRTVLAGLGGAAVAGAAGLGGAWHMSGKIHKHKPLPDGEWANWSRNQQVTPGAIVQPSSLEELKAAVQSSQRTRIVGAGHSFTSLVPTDGTIINLDKMGGVHSANREAKTAWMSAGTRLKDLSPALEADGLAFKNLGDINVQSLAGATSTATHGTGKTFPCLSAELTAVKLLTANGDMLTASADENPDLLSAAQVSLGSLGIIVDAEVSLTEPYRLNRRSWSEPLETTLAEAMTRWDTHRNFEFFYVPFSGTCIAITHDKTEAAITPRPESKDDSGVMGLKQVRDFAGWKTDLRKSMIADAFAKMPVEDVVEESWKLLSSERNVYFNEMEYHLPPERALDVLGEVIDWIETNRPDVFFPIEVRRTRGDDAWLSPFQGGGRISIAVHAYFEDEYDWFFSGIEPIFRKAGGRPHWGKLHSLKATDFEALYPDFDRFRDLRKELDPTGKFLNTHLAALWGETINA